MVVLGVVGVVVSGVGCINVVVLLGLLVGSIVMGVVDAVDVLGLLGVVRDVGLLHGLVDVVVGVTLMVDDGNNGDVVDGNNSGVVDGDGVMGSHVVSNSVDWSVVDRDDNFVVNGDDSNLVHGFVVNGGDNFLVNGVAVNRESVASHDGGLVVEDSSFILLLWLSLMLRGLNVMSINPSVVSGTMGQVRVVLVQSAVVHERVEQFVVVVNEFGSSGWVVVSIEVNLGVSVDGLVSVGSVVAIAVHVLFVLRHEVRLVMGNMVLDNWLLLHSVVVGVV